MSHSSSGYQEEQLVLELRPSPAGAFTIFDLPPSHLGVAERIVAELKARAYIVRMLEDEHRLENATQPYGMWPHPDPETIEMMSREAELPVLTSEQLAELGRTALTRV